MQMKLETNLPVVFLTLLVIGIVVLGYLELKKMNERIKVIEYFNNGKKNSPDKLNDVKENIVHDVVEGVNKVDGLKDNGNNRVQEWQMNNEKDNIINTLNRKEEYIEEIEEGQSRVFFNGGMFPPQSPMMYKVMDGDERGEKDEIIDKINNDETVDFENNNGEEEILMDEIGDEVNKEIIIEETDGGTDGGTEEDDDSDMSGDESVEELNLKEINDEEDFSKNKISVDESFSVNELKVVCRNLGIQFSGNKSTLIKRIMDNQ